MTSEIVGKCKGEGGGGVEYMSDLYMGGMGGRAKSNDWHWHWHCLCLDDCGVLGTECRVGWR
jgi:hypothetical protein